MKKILQSVAIISTIILSSCGNEKQTTSSENTNKEEICFYSYDETAKTQVRWTAFKTSEKIAVGGQFNQVNVTIDDKSTKITDVLKTVKFNIPTSSTNTANEDRDSKIVESFFGVMNGTDLIIGQVKDATGDNTKGTCTFYLTLNNIEKETTLDYLVDGETIKLTGEIDIVDWNAEASLEALNKVCGELHKGDDGISKTWSVVELAIETNLKKTCH